MYNTFPWVDSKPTQAALYKGSVTIGPGEYTITHDVKGALYFYICDGFGASSEIY